MGVKEKHLKMGVEFQNIFKHLKKIKNNKLYTDLFFCQNQKKHYFYLNFSFFKYFFKKENFNFFISKLTNKFYFLIF